MKRLAIVLSALCLATGLSNAQNLLLNGDFNAPGSGAEADNWTRWWWGEGWANYENNPTKSLDGSYYMANGGMNSGGGGEYQTVPATAGVTYTLSVKAGADTWWLPSGEMRLFFQDASGTQIGSTFVQPTLNPAAYGGAYDIAHPWADYSMTALAPAGTAQVKVEFMANANGGVWYDNASLVAVPEPSMLGLLACGSALLLARRHRRSA